MKSLFRFNLPAAWLLLLLERTPMLRVASINAGFVAPSRIVSLLKAALAGSAALGATHSLAGATQFVVSNSNVFGTVGTAITPIAFTVTGATVPAGSYQISGTLPPGITLNNAGENGVLNAESGSITGTPTTAGTYVISILAYHLPNAAGDTVGPTQIGFVITNTASSVPIITTQPASQSINAGANAALTVVATGSPAPTFQWRKNGTLIAGATSASLPLSNIQPTDAGSYTVVVSNLAGIVVSNPATVTVTSIGPIIREQPQSQHLTLGGSGMLTATATGTALKYQWIKDGTPIPGASNASFSIGNASIASMGFYAVAVSDNSGTSNSAVAAVTVDTGGASRLVNVSTRGYIPAGGALTPGFVLQGNPAKSLVIRGVGPTLGAFGVDGTLADPTMEVIPLGQSVAIAANDNWGGATALTSAFIRVGAFPFAASTSGDSTVETRLSASGASGYTVRITSTSSSGAGIALAEVYDDESLSSPVRLINVSTSGYVGSGDQALVPGFFVGGTAPKQLLIRAVGPGLAQFGVTGVLANPQLSIVPLGRELVVAANDNWGGTTALQNAFTQAGAFAIPPASADAAVLVRLPPGGYTVVVSGVSGTTGTALVEIYDLDP